jgi:hypothetical protein
MISQLSIVLLGGTDLEDVVLARDESGGALDEGLADVLRAAHPELESVTVRRVDARPTRELAADLPGLIEQVAGADVVLRSLQPDLDSGTTGPALATEFREAMATVIGAVKDAGGRMFILNGATYDPHDTVSCYVAGETEPLALHRLNLELFDLSMLDGISVIDADRLVAETGGATHVRGCLDYSPELLATIRDEVVFVLEDYGFFDDRPVLAQQGRRER